MNRAGASLITINSAIATAVIPPTIIIPVRILRWLISSPSFMPPV